MQSVSLWCDYINFIQEHDQAVSQCAPAGILKMRDLLERALTAAGLHVAEGSKIWEAYREFEQAIFFTIDDTDIEVRISFHRLSCHWCCHMLSDLLFIYLFNFLKLVTDVIYLSNAIHFVILSFANNQTSKLIDYFFYFTHICHP